MIPSPSLLDKPLSFVQPDHEERRGDAHLLVWRDLPHWTVVDDEMHGVLSRLDGRTRPRDLLAEGPEGRESGRALQEALRRFRERGIVGDGLAVIPPSPVVSEPRIENIAVNVTLRCNLRCRFCYNLGQLAAGADGELAADEVVRVLDAARPFLGAKPSLSLLGGEPLLDPEKTLAIAGHAAQRGFQTIVSTNGIPVTPALARRARRAGLQVQVSVDGSEAALHDAVRGRGAFAKAVVGVRALVDAGAYTILSGVCHRGNLADLERFYDLALALGVREARFIPLKRMGGMPASGLEPSPLPDLMREAAGLFRRRPALRSLTGRDAFSIVYTTCRYSLRKRSCGTGSQTFLLDANGDLYPCLNTNIPDLRAGNIRTPGFDFARFWNDSPVLRTVRRDTSVDEEANRCRTCSVKYWCLGGCRGETRQTQGSLGERAWNCGEQKRAVLDMFWLLAEGSDLVRMAGAFEH